MSQLRDRTMRVLSQKLPSANVRPRISVNLTRAGTNFALRVFTNAVFSPDANVFQQRRRVSHAKLFGVLHSSCSTRRGSSWFPSRRSNAGFHAASNRCRPGPVRSGTSCLCLSPRLALRVLGMWMATDLLLETPSAPPLRVDAMGPSLLVIGLLCGTSDPGNQ